MPDRATGADLQLAADLATKAANDIDELVQAKPPGCICQLIERDDYSYVSYAEGCQHHGELYRMRAKLRRTTRRWSVRSRTRCGCRSSSLY